MTTYSLHEVSKGFNLADPNEHDALHVTVKKTDDDGDVTYHPLTLSDADLTAAAKGDDRTAWDWPDVAVVAAQRLGKPTVLVPVVAIADPQPNTP